MFLHAIARPGRAALASVLARFRREDEGSITLFTLFIFILMILIGGLAVDLMRFETRRAVYQNTVDSAVLAAADLEQELDAQDVIDSYFERRGLDPEDATVVEIPSYVSGSEMVGREVRVNSRLEVDTFFMHMMGIEQLRAPVTGAALEEIRNVEISLVLDISGSMRWDKNNGTPANLDGANRINDLKASVIKFVDAVLQVDCDDHALRINCVQSPSTRSTTINIIPYAGHVNPGPHLFALMGGNRWHSWSSCKEVTDADFDDTDLPDGTGDQLPHFMRWNIDTTWMEWGWCPQDQNGILVAENDAGVLVDYINAIQLHDGTATHIGMKYGLALLSPSSRDEFAALNGIVVDGRPIVADDYKDRPGNWEDDTLKFVVLMTDGKTTDQFRPKVGSLNWDYGPLRGLLESSMLNDVADASGNAAGLENAAVFDMTDYLADLLDRYGSYDSNGDANPRSDVETGYPAATVYTENGTTHNAGTNNAHITAMCDKAKEPVLNPDGTTLKEDRVTVFTISFLAPSDAQTLMEGCASTTSHYFKVQDLDVGKAFKAIAKTINQLRLSQ